MRNYDFPESFGFTFLFRTKKICHITVNKENIQHEFYKGYYEDPTFQLLLPEKLVDKREWIIHFLLTRTLEESNPRCSDVYRHYGLDSYLPYAYIHKLHGVINMDGMWLMFDDETDLEFRPPMYGAKGCELIE